ncbi:MAG: tRNA (guanosine(46)-N7)-methyltransferase TrmB [Magnetococcales bacterium]|jgi:tRNA (guanine-N7-)-methyltransferase|nr:tRNA (guanosine(46)-N7)-methyltransferase TrmB [Magnetococcales bacterium]|tara:strand:+ start:438289 stop:439005 length:717 start_codon:yes stop_codon:yes gene_type:complete
MTKRDDKELRSYGRIASRMSVAEQKALDAELAPYIIDPKKLETSFEVSGPLTVEIGVGKGEQIVEHAKRNPNNRYIASEVFKNGLQKMLREIQQHDIKNLKLFSEDGRELLAGLPEASVDRMVVLYPDPWPKTRHKKRRIVNEGLLKEAHRLLKPDGELRLVTDVVDYALWMMAAVNEEGTFFPTAISPKEWSEAPADWVSTGYERKALKEGRCPFYFVLKRREDMEKQNHNKGMTTE